MRYVEVDGLRTSVIGLGTWQFGSREWGYGERYATETAPALVRRALELGVTMLDTAEAYGPGRSERIIGRALAEIPVESRTDLVLATKFLPIAPAEPILARQAAGSRRRLGVDALDLYYAHWPNPFVSARRTMQALRPLVERGLVRHLGVSNYGLARWQDAERAARMPIVADQVRFSLLSPRPAVELVPYASAMGRLVVAYSPLAQGILTRGAEGAAWVRDAPGAVAVDGSQAGDGGDRTGADGMPRAARPRGLRGANRLHRRGGAARLEPLARALAEIAAASAATPAQVALAWVIHHPNTVAIPGARTIRQLEENAAAADLVLADDDLARLSELAAPFGGDAS